MKARQVLLDVNITWLRTEGSPPVTFQECVNEKRAKTALSDSLLIPVRRTTADAGKTTA